MLAMNEIHVIKHKYENEGKSAHEIAGDLGFSPTTVRKYLSRDDWNEAERPRRERKQPVLGAHKTTIDEWLSEDMKSPRKQRHTARRVYDRLCKEKGYQGKYGTVQKYVAQKKDELYKSRREGCLPLTHIAGNAQIDFGKVTYILGGKEHQGSELVVSFPHSNAGWSQLLPGENMECLFTGLQSIFKHIGGTPVGCRFDNMSTAVVAIGKGSERTLTDGFTRFMLHFRFQSSFCNPSKGNEKGSVENKVGYLRRNMCVPLPEFGNLEEFNRELLLRCDEDMEREHYLLGKTIRELWDEDKAALLNLPETRYDTSSFEPSLRVSPTGMVTVDTRQYGLSPEYAGRLASARVRYDKVALYIDDALIVTYDRLYGSDSDTGNWKQYLETWRKKPGGLEYTRYFNTMPQYWQDYLLATRGSARKSALALLTEIVNDGNDGIADDVIELAREQGRTDLDSIRQCYRFITEQEFRPHELTLSDTVPRLEFEPILTAYDALTGGESPWTRA
jgi:transposase